MQARWPIQDAKNQFSKVVDTALQGTPQVVTRRGVPVVVVVAAAQFDILSNRDSGGNGFARFLLSMPWGGDEPRAAETVADYRPSALELREVEF
jgi:prevent-host-death family protein